MVTLLWLNEEIENQKPVEVEIDMKPQFISIRKKSHDVQTMMSIFSRKQFLLKRYHRCPWAWDARRWVKRDNGLTPSLKVEWMISDFLE